MPLDPSARDGALSIRIADSIVTAAGATSTTLSTAETQALLARLEPLPPVTGPAPALRAPSLAPTRSGPSPTPIAFVFPTGNVIADLAVSKPKQIIAPLVAPYISPSGDVRAESEVRIRFDEPMVAIAATGTVATAPATITPHIAGTWRWIDTHVATFTADSTRFPAATEYTVTVAAGTRAVSGARLAAAETATFATPPVMITGAFPTSELRPDSPLVVNLDQEVDPATLFEFLRVEANKRPVAFQPITLAEARALWARNPSLVFDDKLLATHHVILAPKTAWPAGVDVRVVLGKGAPSKEGPRVTIDETDATFSVVAPFTVRGLRCDGIEQARMTGLVCPARSYFSVELSNSIYKRTYSADKIQIDGQPFEDHTASDETVMFTVPDPVGRTFAIKIADGITDVFGQPLVGPKRPSFTTKPERFDPSIDAPGGLFVLDPRFEIPQWVIETQAIGSLRVQLYQVQPADYFAFEAFEAGKRATPPGKRVYDKQHAVGKRWAATARVDLRPALGTAATGHIIAVASASNATTKRVAAWIQVSRLGVTARLDGEQVSAWVQQIAPAHLLEPVPGIAASLLVEGRTDAPAPVTTDARGHAVFELLPARKRRDPDDEPTALLLARSPTDSVFRAIRGRHEKAVREHDAHWYVTDDRFTYRPGETVYVKGWVRWSDSGVNPSLAFPSSGESIAYTLTDRRDNKLASGTAKLTDQGGFDLEVKLPANANLGIASFHFETKHETHRHPIAIEEYRAPAFAVSLDDDVTHGGGAPLLAGETIEMNTTAKYYSGGGLAGAIVRWRATLSAASYRPPGWDRFSFSPVRPPNERYYRYRGRNHDRGNGVATRATGDLADSGSTVALAVPAVPNGEPAVLTVETNVTDLDRSTVRASSRPILVHPSAYYVGLRQQPNTGDTLELVVTDLDGAIVPGVPIDVTIEGILGSELAREEGPIKVIDTQHCKVTSAASPVTCGFTRRDATTAYNAVARITDPRGRANAAQYHVAWWASDDSKPDLAIIPDRPIYRAGDVARLEIRSAVVPATAVVSFARQGLIVQRPVELTAASTTIELPIEPGFLQNLHVVVDRFTRRPSGNPRLAPLPHHATAARELRIDIESARLSMKTRPVRPVVQPGELATFEVEVRHDDRPVAGAEVALLAVDEAVLALSAKSHADPLAPFYFDVRDGTSATSTLGLVRDDAAELSGKPGFERWNLDDPDRFRGRSGRLGGRTASVPTVSIGNANAAGGSIKTRSDFRATAVFSPRLITDANGLATVSVKMPDSLTRFRIVALATANTRHFGKAESTIVTQRKINARTVVPRFLTQGDTFTLPVIVQNLDARPRTIDVAVRAANLTASGPSGKRVTIAAGQRAELRFDFASRSRGRAVIQTIASSSDSTDATTVELPVYEPATTESFASYGTIDDDQAHFEQLAVPRDIFTDVGGIEAELASTQLQSLTDAFWYLQTYPYECAEQRSSRMLATTAMADLLDAFATPGRPTRKELEATYANDLKKLTSDQLSDGGWGFFRDMTSDPYVTLQILAALAAHKDKSAVTQRATEFVTNLATTLLARLEKIAKIPLADRKAADRRELPALVSLAAAALASLATTGADVRARAERLHAAATSLASYPIDAKARVLSILARLDRAKLTRTKLLAALLAAAHETGSTATITTSYVEAERLLLVSQTKTTALALDALIREVPNHAIITKLARGLLDGRHRGRWSSTQDNLVVLQVMRRYFDTYEKTTPSYTGKLWLGPAYAEHAFAGRQGSHAVSRLDWSTLPTGSTHDIAIQKTRSPGRMYYRIGITYAPKQTDLPPLDAGFIVRRSYEAVDDPDDVTRTPDGRWKIRLGAKVLVTLETINTTKRYAVAVVDPLPAGFETINTRLATSERAAGSTDSAWDHVNLRDNRSEAFSMNLHEGSHRFSYTARATTPGSFLAAPAKAEEMYSPETFGRSSGTTVVIE